jgi:hypothetical protein
MPVEVSERELEGLLDEKGQLRGFQVFQAAMGAGIALYAVVVLVLHATSTPQPGELEKDVPILTGVNAVMAVGSWAAALLLPSFYVRAVRTGSPPFRGAPGLGAPSSGPETAAGRCLGLARGVFILRIAFLESSALFGLTVCLLAVINGVIRKEPLYWLNALPAALVLAFVLATFPTRERILDLCAEFARKARGAP